MELKKINFLITGLFLSLSVMGQAPTSRVVSAAMPKGAKLLTKEQLTAYVHDNYKRSGIPLDKENAYQLDGVIISFWDLSVNPEFKKSLASEMLAALRRVDNIKIINSQIISVNNVQFLLYEYQLDDEVYLRFQSEYDKNNKNICGIIQFKKPDEDKAHKALQDFLESVHFK